MKKLWQKIFPKNSPPSHYSGKIEVFSRHCIISTISQHKKRIPRFSKEACYANLLETMDRNKANLTCFLDVARGERDLHFLPKENTIEINEGTESGSFLRMLDHVSKLPLHPETILYFVEDDYIHRPGWVDILLEGFQVPDVDYVTLYDHRDKYFFSMYEGLSAKLFATPSCHWRTTPSTTQTFATRFKTLMRDLSLHRKYSKGREISADHAKFLHLQRKGARLISSIPGWSTHAEPEFASPCINWETLLTSNLGNI
jgi:glycosyltransferase involved in cell wall biosynthesis